MKANEKLKITCHNFCTRHLYHVLLTITSLFICMTFIIKVQKYSEHNIHITKLNYPVTAKLSLKDLTAMRIEKELLLLVDIIIDNDLDIDSLQYYFKQKNFSRIHALLGYSEKTASVKMAQLENLATIAVAEQHLFTKTYTSTNEIAKDRIFTMLKNAKESGIRNPLYMYGEYSKRPHFKQEFSNCMVIAFASGLKSGNILGILEIFLCAENPYD